jgi:hypothetical protein
VSFRRVRVLLVALLVMVPVAAAALSGPAFAKTPSQCTDGIDNDGDGLIDLGQDPGCTSPGDNMELDSTPACMDGIDNDGDGFVDFPNDPGCDSTTDTSESNRVATQCADGLDNDRDGFADFPNDPGCFSTLDNSEKTH